jgi:hypothetical protein
MDAASEMAKEQMERVRSTAKDAATAAPATASKVIRDNAVLIGSLGLAIGAILAASLPSTRAEAASSAMPATGQTGRRQRGPIRI